MKQNFSLARCLVAELIGTALLLVAVVGSGMMAESLTTDIAIMLLANAIATGCALIILIMVFGPVSGAHFNPLVTCAFGWSDQWPVARMAGYVLMQTAGAWIGVIVAHAMFNEPLFQLSMKDRSGSHLMFSEVIASFGLLMVILSLVRTRAEAIPYAVAAYITGAYWFTASTSFANPAVTLARAFTDSFAGIQFTHVPGFMLGQIAGMVLAVLLARWLYKSIDF